MKRIERRRNRPGTRLLGAVIALAVLFPTGTTAVSADAAASCYPKCAASCVSLVDALKSVGADASFSSRQAIAAANGVRDYTGSAAQNISLLNQLKRGTLLRSGGAADSGTPLETNLAKVQYISQGTKTCKATAVAMAVNALRGSDVCTTTGMGGAYCSSIEGAGYTGSDGFRYVGMYKTDSYVGSAGELTGAIAAALSAGVPIVAAVHSTASGGTRHHWVVVVGKSGDDYLIVDPAHGGSGTMADNAKTLSARHYAFGLTDYAAPHYGYVTFAKS